MNRTVALCCLVVVLVACPGPRTGPEANATYFWQVKTSTLDWGACSDNADFRTGATPIEVTANSFFVYKVDATGKTATQQDCSALSASTCADAAPAAVFDIAGNELTFTETASDPIGDAGCSLQQNQTWTFTDKVQTFDMEISNVLSLTGTESVCATVESNLKRESPNGIGVEGCVVTFSLGGDLR